VTEGAARHALLIVCGRAEVAFLEIHGETLFVHALRALGEAVPGRVLVAVDADHRVRAEREVRRLRADAVVLADGSWWDVVRASPERGLVVHDVLCPLTPAEFIATASRAADLDRRLPVAAFRPVTDTLKVVVEGQIEGTLDRETVVVLTSPVVLPDLFLADLEEPPPVDDFAALATFLRRSGELELVKAPSLGRRVDDPRAVHLLESMDEVARRVRVERGT
jgi:2-C-methyl-D-erythritol 4-phosphate cytidylyltransferase